MATAIYERVRQIAADILQRRVSEITLHSSPENVENWDSIQNLNLVLALEQEFGLQFEPEEMDAMKTIDGIVKLVTSKTNGGR
jgi:acyl carrier protein